MKIIKYDRDNAVNYALKYALKRNPNYYSFDNLGGDCTNFVSQCVFAGSKIMNYTNTYGWFYKNLNDRSPSWSGVEFFYDFITKNNSFGPFGYLVDKNEVEVGDVIELGNNLGFFYHSAIVSQIINDKIFVCAHTFDALNRPLNSYIYNMIRYIHIDGVRI
ncbi:MAG: amidase domain-containing protein [Clostridia bacterium]|nr:amidase domain-containing protein [Clostridia bacterium]